LLLLPEEIQRPLHDGFRTSHLQLTKPPTLPFPIFHLSFCPSLRGGSGLLFALVHSSVAKRVNSTHHYASKESLWIPHSPPLVNISLFSLLLLSVVVYYTLQKEAKSHHILP